MKRGIVEFETNSIYVIESLLSDDIKTGSLLYNDLIRWKAKQLGIGAFLLTVNSKGEFFTALLEIKRNIQNFHHLPYIHFEIHGCKEGFSMNNGEIATWEEVYDYLVQINILMKNHLFLSLATCYGAYIFNIIDPTKRAPFAGYIGYPQSITNYNIEIDYHNFFEVLLTNWNIEAAMEALAKTEAEHSYIILTAKMMFQMMEPKLKSILEDKLAARSKAKELYQRARHEGVLTNMNRSQRKKHIKELVAARKRHIVPKRDYFLMNDLKYKGKKEIR